MGADIAIKNLKLVNQELRGDILVKSSNLKSTKIRKSEIPLCIDELPILMVAAGLSRGKTVIEGASELRVKETDRISSMIDNLTKIGIEIYSQDDNVYIEGTSIDTIKGSTFNSYNDHRTAMSMAIAAILAKGPSKIMQVECVSKSYPDFFKTLEKLTRQ